MNRRNLLQMAALGALLPVARGAWAQDNAPVMLIVPYAAGGTTDIVARRVAQQLGQALGRTVVVDNKPGAGTAIGASYVARATPDGNTLLVATSTTLAINPSLYKKLTYDPIKDFEPVSLLGAVPLMVVVSPSLDVKSLAELVALSKRGDTSLTFGSAGNGSPQHLAAEMFRAATGANLTHVPYRGTGPALTDLLGGRLSLMFVDLAPALQYVKNGSLSALAVTSAKRQNTLPNVPAIAESGVPGTEKFEAVAWQCIVAPAGTPAAAINRYSQELGKILSQADLRQRFESEGFQPESSSPSWLGQYIRSETDRWAKVVASSGATID